MTDVAFINHHIADSLRAAIAEANGLEEEAKRLRSQARLRLMTMTESDIWELAGVLADYPHRPAEQVHSEIKQAIDQHRATAHEWIPQILRTEEKTHWHNSESHFNGLDRGSEIK